MGYINIEQLIEAAPDVISRGTLGDIKTSFGLAKHWAENCVLGKMVDSLLFVGQGIDDVVDEMAYAFKKGKIESEDYDAYISKLEEFQWGTVPRMVKDILPERCSCKLRKEE
ncbi:unnamed protein product [marine sediment metagenome]|uniref:Uncharacterized protein n=1 Tax=marine sediment metagenome TaxID=412755 RepID=X1FMH9_9ZZZZ